MMLLLLLLFLSAVHRLRVLLASRHLRASFNVVAEVLSRNVQQVALDCMYHAHRAAAVRSRAAADGRSLSFSVAVGT